MDSSPFTQWSTASPDDVGIDVTALDRIEATHAEDNPWMDGLVIVRHGQLVWERYHNGYERDTPHQCKSATKSVLSSLVGIALNRGVLDSLDLPIRHYLEDHLHDGVDSRKGEITVRDCLRMRSGLAWSENDARTGRWIGSEDPIAFSLGDEQPVVAPHGERWCYSTADSQIVGECLARAAGRSLTELLGDWLLDPIGAEGWHWQSGFGEGSWGRECAGSELHLRPVDHARLGLMVLRQGEWNGTQLVPAQWLRQATSSQPGLDVRVERHEEERHPAWEMLPGYGLHWWRGNFAGRDTIVAAGYGGQFCFVVPELDLVVVHHSSLLYERDVIEELAQAKQTGLIDEHDAPVDEAGRLLAQDLERRIAEGRAARAIPDGIAGGLTLMDRIIVPAVSSA